MTDKTISVLVADDHKLFRSGIISLLENEREIFVVGEAENGDELVEKYFLLKPDVVLADISMPVLSGTDAIKKIKKTDDSIRVLFLSMHDDEEYIYYCLKAGGRGLISKNIMKGELILAIKRVYEGGNYFGANRTDDNLRDLMNKYQVFKDHNISGLEDFSQREDEILHLISEGLTSSEIAEKLFISKRTVDTHRTHLMQKLNLKSLPEFIKYAINYTTAKRKNN
jgi:two-component system response regulator NreC